MLPEVHETVVDGLLTFWADLPGPLTGTLTFGVGQRDEPPTLMGITHLIEHLAFLPLEPVIIRHSGTVDEATLSFHATGTPADVVTYLNAVARSARSAARTSPAEIEREARVIRAEHENGYSCVDPGLLTHRFGLRGAGVVDAGSPTTASITPSDLEQWCQMWLVSENAALSFTGPVPDELDLGLPSGRIPAHPGNPPKVATPALVPSGKSGVALSFLVEDHDELELQTALWSAVQRTLRSRSGLTYSPDLFTHRVAAGVVHLAVVLDPVDDDVARTVEEAHELLTHLCEHGFAAEDLERVRVEARTDLAWTSATAHHVDALAAASVLGDRPLPLDEILRRAESTTVDSLRDALRKAMPSLLIAFDRECTLDDAFVERAGLPVHPARGWADDPSRKRQHLLHRRAVWRSRRSGDVGRGRAMAVSSTALVFHSGRKVPRAVRWDAVVLVGRRECGCIDLVDAAGNTAGVDPDDWRRGPSLVDAILQHVPATIVRPFPSH